MGKTTVHGNEWMRKNPPTKAPKGFVKKEPVVRKSVAELIEIETGVPIPDHNAQVYPFEKMNKGQSIWVDQKHVTSARSLVGIYAKKSGKKFVTRAADKDGQPGIRIWRLE